MGGLDVGKSKRSLSPFVSRVLCIFLFPVCHLWEYWRFGSKLDFIFASGHNGEKLGKLILYDLANVRLHCLEEHLNSTFHSVVLN